MRQLFSIRFFAAIGVVVGLFVVLFAVFRAREAIESGPAFTGPGARRIDFVEAVAASTDLEFDIVGGAADRDTDLIIDASRTLTVKRGTPGAQLCPGWRRGGACAVVADLLGEGVVWFALVPAAGTAEVNLPAIDTLDDGIATLVNGWQVPYAPVLDRRCPEDDFASYRELRQTLGPEFTSVYSVAERRLAAVVCHRTVEYAPRVSAPAGR